MSINVVTSATVWNDAVGMRASITYSEVDPETGKIIADNKRIDRVITDRETKALMQNVLDKAQEYVDGI